MSGRGSKSAKQKSWNPILPVYGELWRKDKIDWRGQSGKTRGFLLPGKIGGREADMADQVGVYILFDEHHVPIYIGQAGGRQKKGASRSGNRLFWRLRSHALGQYGDRWKYFSWFGLKTVSKRGLRNFKRRGATVTQITDALEAAMIAASDPRLNSQSGRLSGVTLVKQGNPTARDSLTEHLDEIEYKIDALAKKLRSRKKA